MTLNQDTHSTGHMSAKVAAGIALLSLALAFGTIIGTANARDHEEHWDRGDRGNGGRHGRYNDRHFDDHRGWSGGYYRAPPVIYGNPYGYGYPPPPLVYGPDVGIYLPGVSIGIH